MLELIKSNETKKSEQNYIYSAKDIWELSNSSSRTWDNFVADLSCRRPADTKITLDRPVQTKKGELYVRISKIK